MDIVTIDFETYYDKDYSLSKMTTEAYVRDPRFEVIGVSIKVNDYPTDWYSGSDPGKFLRQLGYQDKAILSHNTQFDGAILSWHYGIRPKLWLDTLSMARGLGHAATTGVSLKALASYYKLGDKGDEVLRTLGMRRADFTPESMARFAAYCVQDTDLTYALFRKLAKGFPPDEIRLIDIIIRMYTEPSLVLDREMLVDHLDAVVRRKEEMLASFGGEDARATLMSNPKFAEYLKSCGVEPPTKISKTTGKPTFAFSKTDKEFLALTEHPDERVSVAVTARLGTKSTIEETRTRSLLEVSGRGSLPILLHYYGAHTGRLSGGGGLNLQNLPRGGAIRRALRAPEGKALVVCDSAQIEARVVAWLAGQDDLVQSFAEGRDVYCEFASSIYGRAITKADKTERFLAKTAILGLGYSMGPARFREALALGMGGMKVDLSESEAKRIVDIYRMKNHRIVSLWSRCNFALGHMAGDMEAPLAPEALPSLMATKDGIRLPNNMLIRYPALQPSTSVQGYCYASAPRVFQEALRARVLGTTPDIDKMTRIYGGKVVENVTQALARVVVTDQMLRISKRYKIALQVHDEVVVICDEDDAENCKAFVEKVMSTPPAWATGLPVACEADYGTSYGEVK
jgi:hypothetical protein